MVNPAVAKYLSVEESTAGHLETWVEAGDYRRRQGFFRAAVMLLEAASGEPHWQERDPLIWPALYNFRHFVELSLKMLARDTPTLVLGKVPTTHELRRLWAPVRTGFEVAFGAESGEAASAIDEAITVLQNLDPRGDGFRYATDRKGAPSIDKDVFLDPRALLGLFEDVERSLCAAEMAFDAHQTYIVEMYEEFDRP